MTQNNSNGVVRVFSARACAAPLEKAAKLFEEQTGIHVQIDVCSRHCAAPVAEEATGETGGDDFLLEISDAGIHDLAIGGAEYLLDDGEIRGIVQRYERRFIASRVSAIIVPAGNPKNIKSVEDMTAAGVRVGVSVIDCLKGLWEDITGRLGVLDQIRKNISYYANGCIAIVEAVADNQVDAAFGWTAFKHLEPDRIEVVEMPKEQQVLRGTGVGMLSFAKDTDAARKFMDFLTTSEARAFYKEFGWVVS
ncbi:MAG: extracellular solute-binding protein [Planctomycetota bacterium]|jgi:accessory colonization factor AcfC